MVIKNWKPKHKVCLRTHKHDDDDIIVLLFRYWGGFVIIGTDLDGVMLFKGLPS